MRGAQTDTLRLLAIGNSFTEDACWQDLYGFFEVAGKPVVIGALTRGGSSLEQHLAWAYDERSTSHWMVFGHLNKEMYPALMDVSREFSEKYKMGLIPPRGMKRARHPLELILSRGYAFITFSAQDVDPDYDDGY